MYLRPCNSNLRIEDEQGAVHILWRSGIMAVGKVGPLPRAGKEARP